MATPTFKKPLPMPLPSDSDNSVHRLEGTTGEEKGGLIIRKKGPSTDSEKHEFKRPSLPAPRVSLLGLDRLAAAKRKQDEEEISEAKKKSRVTSYQDDDESSGSSEGEEATPGHRDRQSSRKKQDR